MSAPSSARASNSRADLDELLEVLDAPLGLDRPLGLEGVKVAGLAQDRLEQVADRDAVARRARAGRPSSSMKRPKARCAAVPRPGHAPGLGGGVPDRDAHRVRVREHARERGLPDPAPRRVGHARERDAVLRVGEQRQVGDRVLDLRALVELRAADDLVADLAADERVLEDPRLRVRPVEDRDLGARHALVDEPLDLADDEPRLGVLVVELADLDLVALAEVGPERLAHPPAVVRDDRVGGVEDGLGRAVVLLEPDDLGVGEVVLEIEDVA